MSDPDLEVIWRLTKDVQEAQPSIRENNLTMARFMREILDRIERNPLEEDRRYWLRIGRRGLELYENTQRALADRERCG